MEKDNANSTASPGKVEIQLSQENRPWLRPLTHSASTVQLPNQKCHKTLEQSLADTQAHAGFAGDAGEADDTHPDAGHEMYESAAQEKSEHAGPSVKGVKQNGQGVTGSY